MSGLIWATSNDDSRLLDSYPAFEESRLLFRRCYLFLLSIILGIASFKFIRVISSQDGVSGFAFVQISGAVLGALFFSIFSLSLFRLMFSSTRMLRVTNAPRGESWSVSAWIKLAFMAVFGAYCAMAACLFLFEAETSSVMTNPLTSPSLLPILGLAGSSDELDSLYEQLSGAEIANDSTGVTARIDALNESKQSPAGAETVGAEPQVLLIRQQIDKLRLELRTTAQVRHLASQNRLGLIAELEHFYTLHRGFYIIVLLVFVFIYAAPVYLHEIAEQGIYEYVSEMQAILVLGGERIIPNAKTLWVGDERYFVDRYMKAESVTEAKLTAHRRLRTAVRNALISCLRIKKTEFSEPWH